MRKIFVKHSSLGRRSHGWKGRLESTACGEEVVKSGVAAWSVACTGEKFMIGIVPDERWAAFAEESPTFVPFVCQGGGFGIGLLAWDGVFLCQAGHGDQHLQTVDLRPGARLTVLLDMGRRRVRFFIEGKPVPGAEAVVPNTAHRFAASVYGVNASISFLPPLPLVKDRCDASQTTMDSR